MELDLQRSFGLHDTPPLPPPRNWAKALLVSQDRLHLFVTPCNYWFTRAGAEPLPLPGRALPGGRGELPPPSALSGKAIPSIHKILVSTSRPLQKETVPTNAHVWSRNLMIAM